MTVSDILKDLIEKKAISQREAARRIGVKPMSMNAWINEEYEPKIETVNAILADLIEFHNAFQAVKKTVEPELPKLVEAEPTEKSLS